MKIIFLILVVLLFKTNAFSQSDKAPMEVTPAIEKKIALEIEKELALFKDNLSLGETTAAANEFSLDTFRIESIYSKYLDYDWTTAGMSDATYVAASKYDSLLNKYYKKLLAVLNPTDKPVLINAQKCWMAFRDNELKLVDTISKEEYSGGGTVQQLNAASEYLNIIKQRTIVIFQHYQRASQDY